MPNRTIDAGSDPLRTATHHVSGHDPRAPRASARRWSGRRCSRPRLARVAGTLALVPALLGWTLTARASRAAEIDVPGRGPVATPEPLTSQRPGPFADTLVLRVGSDLLAADRLLPFRTRWEQRWSGPEGEDQHQRYIEESLTVRESAGGPLLQRTQRFLHADGGTTVATNLLDRNDLRPRRWHEVAADGAVTHLDFHGPIVSGAFVGDPASPAVLVHRELPEAPFDQRAAGLLFAALPLETGMSGRFPFAPLRPPVIAEPRIQWYTFTVEGRETVDSPALGTVEAWRVRTSQTFTFWVTDRPPYVVQVRFPLRGGHSTFRVVASGEDLAPGSLRPPSAGPGQPSGLRGGRGRRR